MKRYRILESGGGYFYIEKLTKLYHRAWNYIPIERHFTTKKEAEIYVADLIEKERNEKKERKKQKYEKWLRGEK